MEQEIKPKKSSRFFTEYYGVAFLFLIAAFVVTAVFVHRPLITQIKMINAETQGKLAEAQAERSYLSSVEASVAAAQSIPPGVLKDVDQALPTSQNLPSLLVQFGSAALSNNVRIDTISFSESVASNGLEAGLPSGMIAPLDVSLSVRAASYFEMKRFLADIESSLRIMDILSMTSSGSEEGGESSYSIQLRTYSYIPPAIREAQP